MKNIKKNSIILIIITMLVIFFVLKDNFNTIIALLTGANILWLLVALLAEFLFIFLKSLAFYQLILSYEEDYSLFKSFKLLVITKFFNGITPFASGGQPMQVYLMKKDGIRMSKSINIIIQNFIIYQLALVTLGIFALICNNVFNIFPDIPILRRLVAIGFLVNTLVMVVSFIVSFSKKFNKFIIDNFIKITTKLRLVKDEEKYIKKWEERCEEFHKGAEFIKNNKWLCFKCYIYNIIALTFLYAIPLFVIIALDKGSTISILNTIVASSYVMIIGAFVPIPGGTGGIEFGFLQFFGNLIKGNTSSAGNVAILNASLLMWRFITYYVPMVVGAVLLKLRKEAKE